MIDANVAKKTCNKRANPPHLCKKKLWTRLENYVTIELRSEEHTSELQSRGHLVCRLLLEKKKKKRKTKQMQKRKNDSREEKREQSKETENRVLAQETNLC